MEFIVVALWLVHSILPRLWPCNLLAELLLIVEIPHRTCPCVVICASGAYVLMTEYFRTFLWSEDKLYGLLLASQSDFFQTIAMPFHSNLSETSQWQSTSTWEPDLIIIRDQKWGKFPTSKRYLERMWEVIAWLTMSISVLTFQAAMASTLLVQSTIGQFFFLIFHSSWQFRAITLAQEHIIFSRLEVVLLRADCILMACTTMLGVSCASENTVLKYLTF